MVSESYSNGDRKYEVTQLLSDEKVLNITPLNWNHMVSAYEPRYSGSVSLTGNGVFVTRSGRILTTIIDFIILDKGSIEDWRNHPFGIGVVKPTHDNVEEEIFLSVDLRINESCFDNLLRALLRGSSSWREGGVSLQIYIRQPSPSDWDKLKDNDRYKEHHGLLAVEKFIAVVEGGKQMRRK